MKVAIPRSRTLTFWIGLTLLVLGMAFAMFGVWTAASGRAAARDLESRVDDLRAKGAIVENYYKILGGDGESTPSRPWLPSCVIAGILVVGGAAMVVVSREPLPFPRRFRSRSK